MLELNERMLRCYLVLIFFRLFCSEFIKIFSFAEFFIESLNPIIEFSNYSLITKKGTWS